MSTESPQTLNPPQKSESISRSEKAGINMPVGKIQGICKANRIGHVSRISGEAPVILAAAADSFLSGLIKGAQYAANRQGRTRVRPCDIHSYIENDTDYHQVLGNLVIVGSGPRTSITTILSPSKLKLYKRKYAAALQLKKKSHTPSSSIAVSPSAGTGGNKKKKSSTSKVVIVDKKSQRQQSSSSKKVSEKTAKRRAHMIKKKLAAHK